MIKFFSTIVSFLLWKVVPKSFWATVYTSYLKNSNESYYICDCSNIFRGLWQITKFRKIMQVRAYEFLIKDNEFYEYIVNDVSDVTILTLFRARSHNLPVSKSRQESRQELRKAFLEYIISKL